MCSQFYGLFGNIFQPDALTAQSVADEKKKSIRIFWLLKTLPWKKKKINKSVVFIKVAFSFYFLPTG